MFHSAGSEHNSPKVSQVTRSNSKPPMGAGDVFEKPSGMHGATASTAAECDEYLRVLHKQLVKVLKNKQANIPPDVGEYH